MPRPTRFHLSQDMFNEKEKTLVEHDTLVARTFRFETGVCGLRLINELGELVLLPFQGQQIWSARFCGRDLTMKSMFTAPRPTDRYLENYGAFLLHCGASAVGAPSADDTHPLHGELPNASYQKAWLLLGEDRRGSYLGLSGEYQHTVAFSQNYLAEPLVKLYAGSSLFWAGMSIQNLKQSDMELMYLAHINFKPVDYGRLVYSALCTPQHVRVRTSIPSHIHPGPKYRELLASLTKQPEIHNIFDPGLVLDPEIVLYIDYLADEDGWAHSMQVHPDGTGDYVRHMPAQLRKGIRWIVRSADQQALGLIIPATSEPEGYLAEKAKGNIIVLPPGDTFECQMEIGVLGRETVAEKEEAIRAITEQS